MFSIFLISECGHIQTVEEKRYANTVLRSVASLFFSLRLAALFPRYTCIIVYVGAIMVLGLLIILMFWIWGVAAREGRQPMTGRRSRLSRSASRRVRCVFFIFLQIILTVLQHVLHFQGLSFCLFSNPMFSED